MKIKVYDIEFTWEEDGLDYNCLNLPDEIEFNTDYIVNILDIFNESREYDEELLRDFIFSYIDEECGCRDDYEGNPIYITLEDFKFDVDPSELHSEMFAKSTDK